MSISQQYATSSNHLTWWSAVDYATDCWLPLLFGEHIEPRQNWHKSSDDILISLNQRCFIFSKVCSQRFIWYEANIHIGKRLETKKAQSYHLHPLRTCSCMQLWVPGLQICFLLNRIFYCVFHGQSWMYIFNNVSDYNGTEHWSSLMSFNIFPYPMKYWDI